MKPIDHAILNYLDDDNPVNLDSFILNPSLIVESIILPEDHILKDEAIIILDSLNSYNKGISNKERVHDLLEIPEYSPLYSWRCGVLAIKEFYSQNQKLVTDYLNEIRENSPVKNLNKFILKDKETALFFQDKNLNSSVDALHEVITNSLLDMYPTTVKLLLDDLKGVDDEELQNTILTIIEESIDNVPLEMIHKSIFNVIPVSESTRLMALGTMYKFPIKSLGYLFSYANLAEFDDRDDENFKALLSIIKEIVKALIKEKYLFTNIDEKRHFIKDSNIFIHTLREFYVLDFKESPNPLTNLRRALDIKLSDSITTQNVEKNLQGELF